MCLIGHLIIYPTIEKEFCYEENMPDLYNWILKLTFETKNKKPSKYCYHDDFVYDCILLACSFSLKSGVHRLCTVYNRITLPLLSITKISRDELRYWLSIGLCLLYTRTSLDNKIKERPATPPKNSKLL